MATKSYNKQTFTFMFNGEAVSFYCDTTYTRNGFCHHVFTWGLGKENEHTRVSYINRTWESFCYESALKAAIRKFAKKLQAPLRLEVERIANRKREEAEATLAKFEAAFNSLTPEKKAAVQKYTPELTNIDQAKAVTAAVQLLAAV